MKKPESLVQVEKLEKELGKKEFSKLIDEWEKEYQNLYSKWKYLHEKRKKDIFSTNLWKKVQSGEIKFEDLDKFSGGKDLKERYDKITAEFRFIDEPKNQLYSKLHWARTRPEIRKVEIELSEKMRMDDVKKNKEIQKIESRITLDQKELRKMVIGFNNYCFNNKTLYAPNRKEADELGKEINKKATIMLENILDKVKEDFTEVKPLLIDKEWEEFLAHCKLQHNLGHPIVFFVVIRPGEPAGVSGF